jgi:formylglycine-generating enzyme required for sulfatase activity
MRSANTCLRNRSAAERSARSGARTHHAVFRERVAVKVPTDPQYIRHLRTEGMIQHQVAHPHIVRTFTVNPAHEPPYLVMEYVEGSSLRDLLRGGKPLPVETAVDYLRQVLKALSAAHAAGAIHRDLKPENILIDRANQVKVTDFGLGRVQQATSVSLLASGSMVSSSGASLVGTIEYMAPEQKNPDAEVDRRCDLYEEDRYRNEGQHKVKFTKPFCLGVHQATQAQWGRVMGGNPGRFKGGVDLPVANVSWEDAVASCRSASATTGRTVRLPTEAEREHACRAGEAAAWNLHGVPLGKKAWYDHNSGRKTHPVGLLLPNHWGLYDMHGNVWEWCADWYGEYESVTQTDPEGRANGDDRVLRGGGWRNEPRTGRSANRTGIAPDGRGDSVGFRIAVDVR